VRRKRIAGLAVLAALALVAAACGREQEAPRKPTLKIAFMGALTGDYAQLVIHAKQGAQLAIEQANAKGDLPVRLELLPEDTQGSKDNALPIANQLKDDTSVVAVIGPAFSGESFAVNPILGQAGIPQVTPSATNPGLNAIAGVSGKTWFRAVGNDNSQAEPTPDIIFKYLKGTKVYVAHDKSAYGQGLATIVRDGVQQKYPGKLAGFEGVDPGKKDYSPLVSKIIQSGADVLYWGAYSPEGSLILKQLRERGSRVQYVGADGSKDDTFLKIGADAEGAVLTCPCSDPTASSDPDARKFVTDYKARWNADPGVYGGEGYDSALLIIDAIRKAGAFTSIADYRAKVARNLKETRGLKGVTKTYEFQDNGELVASAVQIYVYKVVGGKFVLQGKASELVT
jgi:branched-chain amino acid transport system substrate-binding protein